MLDEPVDAAKDVAEILAAPILEDRVLERPAVACGAARVRREHEVAVVGEELRRAVEPAQMLVCRPAVQVDDRGRRRAVLDRFLVRDIDEGGDRETVLARVSKVHRLDERLGIDPTRQGRGDGARLHMGRFPYPRVERSARAAVHVRHRLAVGCDARAHVHAGKVRDGLVVLSDHDDALPRAFERVRHAIARISHTR